MKKTKGLLMVLAAAAVVARVMFFPFGRESVLQSKKEPVRVSDAALGLQTAIIDISEKVGTSIVSIKSTTEVEIGASTFLDDPALREYFRNMGPLKKKRTYQTTNLGSGIIVSQDGFILTNEHVVRHAKKIRVQTSSGRSYTAVIQGIDKRSDLAIIKISAQGLRPIEFADSDKVRVGEFAVAIGNPFGLANSVSFGVVSAIKRTVSSSSRSGSYYGGLIQTDAAINPGNSGGALVDIYGKLIGINVMIFSKSGAYQGVGFAIPSNVARFHLETMKQGEEVRYGWLGVALDKIDDDMVKALQLKKDSGALVKDVQQNSPADRAGLRRDDIVVAYNGKPVKDMDDLIMKVGLTRVDTTVPITVVRKGKEIELEVTVTERKENVVRRWISRQEGVHIFSWRGIIVRTLTDEAAESFNVKKGNGVLITYVNEDSIAYQKGLRKGMIVDQVVVKGVTFTIKSVDDFQTAVRGVKGPVALHTTGPNGISIVAIGEERKKRK